MNFSVVHIEKDEENVIIGQSHFIKTVEDLYEAIKNSMRKGTIFISCSYSPVK